MSTSNIDKESPRGVVLRAIRRAADLLVDPDEYGKLTRDGQDAVLDIISELASIAWRIPE